ncbi:hypothetical protein D5086_024263 [Populus alba]|uniref:Uncharacterized protein n=1 Tax=Populus alba TaxID=43335 RepID=A0ACC4B509_POPAL
MVSSTILVYRYFLDNPFGSLLSFWLTVVADLQQLLYLVSNDLTCTLASVFKEGPGDFLQALKTIPRTMRMMQERLFWIIQSYASYMLTLQVIFVVELPAVHLMYNPLVNIILVSVGLSLEETPGKALNVVKREFLTYNDSNKPLEDTDLHKISKVRSMNIIKQDEQLKGDEDENSSDCTKQPLNSQNGTGLSTDTNEVESEREVGYLSLLKYVYVYNFAVVGILSASCDVGIIITAL